MPDAGRMRCCAVGAVSAASLLSLAFGAVGCGLEYIDRKTNRLVAEAARAIGTPVTPERSFGGADAYRRPGQASKSVETTSPLAGELQYDTAPSTALDPERVRQRLDSYGQIDEANALRINLETALRIAQESAREYLSEEENLILESISLLVERHVWSPRFFNTLATDLNGDAVSDGSTALRIVNTLRATQRLPYGGDVEASLVWQATEQLRRSVSDDYTQSTRLALDADIPLLRGAGLIAQESLIQAERDLIYAARDFERFRRGFLQDIATDYLNLIAQVQQIENQERSIGDLELSYEQSKERVVAGRERPSQRNRVGQSLESSRSNLINQRERYIFNLDRFKIRLGIPVSTPVVIDAQELDLPDPSATPTDAAELALRYRLDLQNSRDQIDDSRRSVANSRNQLLPGLDLSANTTFPTDGDEVAGGFNFDNDDFTWALGIDFDLPLDREIERLNYRSSIIRLNRAVRNHEQDIDNVILNARSARRAIDQRRFELTVAEGNVVLNQATLDEFRLREDTIDAFDLTDAQADLLDAENNRDSARRDVQIAILEYLLTTGQMRVDRDGQLEFLRGMPSFREPDAPVGAEGGPAGDAGVPDAAGGVQ